MDPGGPAIIEILPRLKLIFFSSKMGQGGGRGSPALTPRLTSRANVRTRSSLLARLADLATQPIVSRILRAELVTALAVRCLAVRPEPIRSGAAKILRLRYRLQVLRVAARLVVAQVVDLEFSGIALG